MQIFRQCLKIIISKVYHFKMRLPDPLLLAIDIYTLGCLLGTVTWNFLKLLKVYCKWSSGILYKVNIALLLFILLSYLQLIKFNLSYNSQISVRFITPPFIWKHLRLIASHIVQMLWFKLEQVKLWNFNNK